MARPKGKSDSKAKIVDAAWSLFYENGYDNTTVDAIIERSGTSKGSFYYYFNAKDDLLETLSNVLDDYYEQLCQQIDDDMNCMDQLLLLNEKSHSMMEQKIDLELLTKLYSTQLGNGDKQHQLLDKNRIYYRVVTQLVEKGQQRGEITKDKSSSEIVWYYSMCERALVSEWCMSKGSYSLADKSKEFMPIMMEHFKVNDKTK